MFVDTFLSKIGIVRKSKTEIPLVANAGATDPFALWLGDKKLAADKAMAINTGWVYCCMRAISKDKYDEIDNI